MIFQVPGSIDWQPNVSGDSDVLTLQVTLPSPIKQNSVEEVRIVFSVLNVGTGKDVEFKGTVKT